MSIYVLNIKKGQKPNEFIEFLAKNKPQKGDKVKLVSEDKVFFSFLAIYSIALFALALGHFYKRKQLEDTEKLLNSLFENSTAEEYEKLIEKEFGIIVEFETKNKPDDDWHTISMGGLSNAYDTTEPDISQLKLKEPNPNYNSGL